MVRSPWEFLALQAVSEGMEQPSALRDSLPSFLPSFRPPSVHSAGRLTLGTFLAEACPQASRNTAASLLSTPVDPTFPSDFLVLIKRAYLQNLFQGDGPSGAPPRSPTL